MIFQVLLCCFIIWGSDIIGYILRSEEIKEMQLLLKNKPLLDVEENGVCTILDFDRLPFALRKENITLIDFIEWASNRTLSIGRSYAKEDTEFSPPFSDKPVCCL